VRFGVRRLPSADDVLRRLGPRARVLELFTGPLHALAGLERALEGYDVAVPIELENATTMQAVRARRRGAVKRVVATVMENIPYREAPNRWVERRIAATASSVDHCVAVTERARLRLLSAGVPAERISLVAMGTDLERFRPVDREHDGPVRILSVARLEAGKGVEDLLIATGLLVERGADVSLTFVGRGPLQPRLERLAAEIGIGERVAFRTVPWESIESAYAEADLFVLASGATRNWREQFGFAVVEAMASGLPVVVGDSGSLSEVAGRPDALVAPHDPLALADRLEPLVRDAGLRAERGAWSRARAEERFDQREARRSLRAVYEQVLAAPPVA
jgi:glycosyltransferase involved in cell wall biosynthesis